MLLLLCPLDLRGWLPDPSEDGRIRMKGGRICKASGQLLLGLLDILAGAQAVALFLDLGHPSSQGR